MALIEPTPAARILRETAELLRPPARITVSQNARDVVRVPMPGGSVGPWSPDLTPYMTEPMDALAAREYHTVCLVGPARTGKTQGLLDGWIAYAVTVDPGPMLIVHTTQDLARRYSKQRVDFLHQHSPAIAALALGGHDDNVYDKRYRHGMMLTIGWPSASQLASMDYRRVALTDYDAMRAEIGPEDASPYALALKRTQTFMSTGMALVESSPRHEWQDLDWKPDPSRPHELPPARGIVSIFNEGDRRLWYWQCPSCGGWYVPDFPEAASWDEDASPDEAAASAKYVCRHCGLLEPPEAKRDRNMAGRWVQEGCALDADGRVLGAPRRSPIASFRIPAGAAAFQPLQQIVRLWRVAQIAYERGEGEAKLRETTYQDHGRPYRPKRAESRRNADDLRMRSRHYEAGTVPDEVRYLTVTVDVQSHAFEMLCIGWGPGLEAWMIDRWQIRGSNRLSGDVRELVEPAAYSEDWDLLLDAAVCRTWPLQDGRRMRPRMVGIDSGGADGVTAQALDFWRRCRQRGLEHYVRLVKGRGGVADRARETYPDSRARSDRHSGGRGDVPVLLLGTDLLKDQAAGMLAREEPGPAYVHFADGLPDTVYDELLAEQRDDRGRWSRQTKTRNETLDLLVYGLGLNVYLGSESMDWDAPRTWALPQSDGSGRNPLIYARTDDLATPTPSPQAPIRRRHGRVLSRGIR